MKLDKGRERESLIVFVEQQSANLDEVFSDILNDHTLQEQVKQAEEQQQRTEERKWAEPYIAIGREYYLILTDPDHRLNERLAEHIHYLEEDRIQKPKYGINPVPDQTPAETYLGTFTYNMAQAKEAKEKSTVRYFLYGFGAAAIEGGDIPTALKALNVSGWLDDKYEGEQLQNSIAQKVQTLEPKEKIRAAMTWKKIQGQKGLPVIKEPTPADVALNP